MDANDLPIIGWHNLVTIDNVTAGTEADGFPASNLANPVTSNDQEWRAADTTDQYITVEIDSAEDVDYVAFARHNFGSAGVEIGTIDEQLTDGGSWTSVHAGDTPTDDSPLVYQFAAGPRFAIRVQLQPGATAPRAAVMYVGKLLTMERGIWVGHTPLKYGRRVNAIDGTAQSGDFLGAIVQGEWRESSAQFQFIDNDWYRENMDPFVSAAVSQRTPFFFKWRPTTYPNESGYARLIAPAEPVPTEPSHLLEIELRMVGVA